MGSTVRPFASIKTADSKRIESQCKAITSIKLLIENDAFKCYVNKTILLSHLKKDIALNVLNRFRFQFQEGNNHMYISCSSRIF